MTIKELREKYNLTQSALARSLGVSSNAISGIEAGRIKLSPKMSAKIKDVYGEEVAPAVPAPEKKAAAPVEAQAVEKTAALKKAAEPDTAPALEKKDDVESAVDEKAAEVATPAAPAPEKKPAKKDTLKKAAPKKSAETVTAEAAAPGAPAKEKKATKKAAPKKAAAEKPAPKKAPPTVILQSPFGGEITLDEVKTLVGEVDKIYVRIDQNKLYWVKGKETGNKDIW